MKQNDTEDFLSKFSLLKNDNVEVIVGERLGLRITMRIAEAVETYLTMYD